MSKVCILNVVGLTPGLLPHAPRLTQVGAARPWTSPVPAVTATSQATMYTGLPPRDHGIVGNGWLYRDTQEVRFWQQSRRLIQGELFYERYETAKMFWWFNQATNARYGATPKPHYGCDGSKAFDVLDWTTCDLTAKLGPFPFFAFWGPGAGIASSNWIADATAIVMREKQPQLTLCYLPHLDYDFQRLDHQDPARVAEVDAAAGRVIDAANEIDAKIVVVSEYGLTRVNRPVHLNRVLRQNGFLRTRMGPFGEALLVPDCEAVAVADHQVAHVYVRNPQNIDTVAKLLRDVPGVAAVVPPGELQLDHPRSGELIVLADSDAWFTYYYWNDDRDAPDFARTVDIHRKPGYDPCELFMTSRARAAARLLQKKIGMRYKMDVIPLDATLVRGSHGLLADNPNDGPLVIGPGEPPADMTGFPAYVDSLL
ncbi:putative AlkP superfamily pyrophosphatase or phosphodiesterase [Rhodopirellula rubra]|uniref:Putative AlkP superfamily pyrophosphatase or phosphodiesterase n=1 Tax=Aporhodopirellula rubra TaxID=980271 RepID=A0A7W5H6I6_9BACT|nr:nucleotide pyrophosphatase/phosphodiesterase family protein [Aporhodopirellula rubra]MBB3208597.1 putative AlkP superfamily pyrophosphatase or phosphodiesterase [Aporhodopirellula rubra]